MHRLPATFCPDCRQPGPNAKDSALRFNADAIIDGAANALLAAQVPLGRLDRNVPEKKLNLLQFATRRMAEPGTRPAKIVWCKPLYACFAGVLADHAPDGFLRQSLAPGLPVLVYPPKQPAGGYVGSLKPFIEQSLDPARHRHGPGVAGFALQVDDRPVVFPLLYVAEIQVHRLVP
jgi:hypothetical protein